MCQVIDQRPAGGPKANLNGIFPRRQPNLAKRQISGFGKWINMRKGTSENIALSLDWLNATNEALDGVASLLTRAVVLAPRESSTSLNRCECQTVATVIENILEETIAVGNVRHDSLYLFSGFQLNTSPFAVTRDSVTNAIVTTTYKGDPGLVMCQVEPGTEIAINMVGDPLFSNVFDALIDLCTALQAEPFVIEDVNLASENLIIQKNNIVDTQVVIRNKTHRLVTSAS